MSNQVKYIQDFETANQYVTGSDTIISASYAQLSSSISESYGGGGGISEDYYRDLQYLSADEPNSGQINFRSALPASGDFTLAFWMNYSDISLNTAGAYWMIFSQNGGSNFFLRVYNPTENLGVTFNGGENSVGAINSIASPDVWHHWCVVVTGSTGYLYVDNVQKYTNTFNVWQPSGSTYWNSIGRQAWDLTDNRFAIDGGYQDVAIWHRALLPHEREALALQSDRPDTLDNQSSLRRYYKMNESSGVVITDYGSENKQASVTGSGTSIINSNIFTSSEAASGGGGGTTSSIVEYGTQLDVYSNVTDITASAVLYNLSASMGPTGSVSDLTFQIRSDTSHWKVYDTGSGTYISASYNQRNDLTTLNNNLVRFPVGGTSINIRTFAQGTGSNIQVDRITLTYYTASGGGDVVIEDDIDYYLRNLTLTHLNRGTL